MNYIHISIERYIYTLCHVFLDAYLPGHHFNCAGVGKSKLGMIRHVRRRTVPCARPVVQAWHVIFLISGFFDSLFLADSGGEEQDDWLLG